MKLMLILLVLFTNYSLADDEIPLPFEGRYESRGSFAKEKLADDQWRESPQDVQMTIVKDDTAIELQLLIKVHTPEGSDGTSENTISNNMRLVRKPEQVRHAKPGRVDFDVYKVNRVSEQLNDLGDGYCGTSECRYSYITAKQDHQQRYHSHITWQPQEIEAGFKQTGGLAVKRDGDSEWMIYKTWENTFTFTSQQP